MLEPIKALSFDRKYSDETVTVPIEENLITDEVETVEELIELWSSKEWGYYEKPTNFRLVSIFHSQEKADSFIADLKKQGILFNDLTKPELGEYVIIPEEELDNIKICDEFGIKIYETLSIKTELWSRPFDEKPVVYYFSSYFAYDCFIGRVYSKDFGYEECQSCSREICVQNPSNGYMSQMTYVEEWDGYICNKCKEKSYLDNGVDFDKLEETRQIPTMFYNTSDIMNAGYTKYHDLDYVLVGQGRSGYRDPNWFIDTLIDLKPDFENYKVIIESLSMSICGDGGYVTVWTKPKENEVLSNESNRAS